MAVRLGLLLALVCGSFFVGWEIREWRYRAVQADILDKQHARFEAAVAESEAQALRLQQSIDRLDQKKAIITKELTRETTKVEYRCAMPASGRMLYERARQGDAAVAGELPDAVRSARTAP